MLENGTVLWGTGFGAQGTQIAEVRVFCRSDTCTRHVPDFLLSQDLLNQGPLPH